MSKRSLQVVIILLSLLPLFFGAMGVLYGAGRFEFAGRVPVNLDSQYRFLSAWYLGLAALAWWIAPRIVAQTTLFRIICGAVFLGGLARLASIAQVGWPDGRFVVVMAIELLFPLLAVWQSALRRPM
jgi:hypothetical protein